MNIGQPKGESVNDNNSSSTEQFRYIKLNYANIDLGNYNFYFTGFSSKLTEVTIKFKITFKQELFKGDLEMASVYSAVGVLKERLYVEGLSKFFDGSTGSHFVSGPYTYTSTAGTTKVEPILNGWEITYTPTLALPSERATKPTGGGPNGNKPPVYYTQDVCNDGYGVKGPFPKIGVFIPEIGGGAPAESPEFKDIFDIQQSIHCTILKDKVSDDLNGGGYSQAIYYGDILNADDKAHAIALGINFNIERIPQPVIMNGEYVDGSLIHLTPQFVQSEADCLNRLHQLVSTGPDGYSLSHNNHSGEENGIKYYSTRPSSKVLEEPIPSKIKTSLRILRFLNKLIGRRNHD